MTHKKHIFISYSSRNKEFVENLRHDLQKAGLNVWIDKEGLTAGTPNWERALREAIRGAYALALVASPDAYESRYVQGEIEVSKMYSCPIYPVWAVGEIWGDCVPMDMIKMQYADMRESKYSVGLEQIIDQLRNITPQAPSTEDHSPTKPIPDGFVPRNPYKGLRAFTQADQSDFFGRNVLVSQLVYTLQDSDFLAVVGPSGSGKSSVVMASLIPKLQAGAIPGSENWVYLDPILPGNSPIEALAISLSDEMDSSINPIIEDLEYGSRGLQLQLRRLSRKRGNRVVLFIDQFEEVFTQTSDPNLRSQFIDLITQAVESESTCKVIITLRADFYDRPMNYRKLAELMEKHSKSILPLSLDELREVIEAPAKLDDVQISFENGLVGDLLYEVKGESGALPLLQFTLDQLFRNRKNLTFSRDVYSEIGGLKGALASHAETTYNQLPTQQHKELCRALFLRLIEPGATEQDTTRRRARLAELTTSNAQTSDTMRRVADIFVRARLLTTTEKTIEVSHEALIREWKRLAEWLHSAREDVRLQKSISHDASEWVRKGKRDDDLYRGARLTEAEQWSQRNIISEEEAIFISASRYALEKETEDKKTEKRKHETEVRKTVVRELHDAATQTMSAIAMRLSILSRMIERQLIEDAMNETVVLRELALRAVTETRALLFRLRPLALESQGLMAALEQLSEKMLSTYHQPVSVFIDPASERLLDVDQKGTIFYLIEEAANNARKYAEANMVQILVTHEQQAIIIRVLDNGRGFDTHNVEQKSANRGSFGMTNMKERAELLGGVFMLRSITDIGTFVKITIPINVKSKIIGGYPEAEISDQEFELIQIIGKQKEQADEE